MLAGYEWNQHSVLTPGCGRCRSEKLHTTPWKVLDHLPEGTLWTRQGWSGFSLELNVGVQARLPIQEAAEGPMGGFQTSSFFILSSDMMFGKREFGKRGSVVCWIEPVLWRQFWD